MLLSRNEVKKLSRFDKIAYYIGCFGVGFALGEVVGGIIRTDLWYTLVGVGTFALFALALTSLVRRVR